MKRTLPAAFSMAAGRSTSLVEADGASPFSPFVVASNVGSAAATPARAAGAVLSPPPSDGEGRRLRQQISMLRLEVERLQTQMDTERARHEQTVASREARIAGLEKDRKFLLQSEQQLRADLEKLQESTKQQIEGLQRNVGTLKRQNEQLQEERSEIDKDRRRLVHAKTALETQIKSTETRHTHQLEALHAELQARDRLIQSRERNWQEAVATSESRPSTSGGGALPHPARPAGELLEGLHRLQVENRRLVYENGILKEAVRTTKLLEERLHTAEHRLEAYRRMEEEFHQLQARLTANTGKVNGEAGDSPTALPISTREIRDLLERTADAARLHHDLGEVQSQWKVARQETQKMAEQLEQAQQRSAQDSERLEELRSKLLYSQGQESILRAEVEMLRGHLEAADKLEKANHDLLNLVRARPGQT